MKTFFMTLLILFGIFALITLLASAFFYKVAISRKGIPVRQKPVDHTDPKALERRACWDQIMEKGKALLEQPMETVSIQSKDGLRLMGYFWPYPGAKTTILCAHGFHGSPGTDFGIISEKYREMGVNLLLIEERAQNRSQGRAITFGVREREDLALWARYLAKRLPGQSIFLHGLSMGGATVLMCADMALPPEVKGIIADCGFTSPWDIFAHVLKSNYHLPPFPILYVEAVFCRVFGGFGVREVSTLDTLRRTRLPVLFIHGEADDFVPYAMGKANFEACTGPKRMVSVPDAGHALSIPMAMERCTSAIADFIDQYQ